ncbi:uncharacterized protein LOC131997055 [Stomoxys calcitrans]|uniref:uncharacterized protein LOC131997055 n=1 Tax=Stomoxys calcitrans TaxID=35570 RepID=UPI0027E392AD|nr:uncharacterized protein LOC131997055 [Stomoxys calcitrans]
MWLVYKPVSELVKVLLLIILVEGMLYEIVLENEEIFSNCPASNGIHDIVDTTEFYFKMDGEAIDVGGNATCKMQGVNSTDRIDLEVEIFIFRRGVWQMTPYSMRIKNFCSSMFNPTTLWYQWWFKYVPEDERLCLTHYGHIYHFTPFRVDASMEFALNVEGRYKGIFLMKTFAKHIYLGLEKAGLEQAGLEQAGLEQAGLE